jgi:hypothetical protein
VGLRGANVVCDQVRRVLADRILMHGQLLQQPRRVLRASPPPRQVMRICGGPVSSRSATVRDGSVQMRDGHPQHVFFLFGKKVVGVSAQPISVKLNHTQVQSLLRHMQDMYTQMHEHEGPGGFNRASCNTQQGFKQTTITSRAAQHTKPAHKLEHQGARGVQGDGDALGERFGVPTGKLLQDPVARVKHIRAKVTCNARCCVSRHHQSRPAYITMWINRARQRFLPRDTQTHPRRGRLQTWT